jgi:hypothetical protein
MIGQAVSPRLAPEPQPTLAPARSAAPELGGPLDPFAMAQYASAEGGGLEAARDLLLSRGELPPPEDDPRTMAEKRASLEAGLAEADALMANPSLSIEEIEALLPGIEVRWAMRALALVSGPGEAWVVEGEVNPRAKGEVVRDGEELSDAEEDEANQAIKRKQEKQETDDEDEQQKAPKKKKGDPNAELTEATGEIARHWVEGLPPERMRQAHQVIDGLERPVAPVAQPQAKPLTDVEKAAAAFCQRFSLPSLTTKANDYPVKEVDISNRRVRSGGKEHAPKRSGQPGYVFGTLLTRPGEIASTLDNYAQQAWAGSEDGGLGRSQVVLGLNGPAPLDGQDPFQDLKLPAAPFPYTVVSFTWSTGLRETTQGQPCDLSVVKEALKAEDEDVQQEIQRRFYRRHFTEETKMDVVPYGALREEIMPETKQAVGSLSKVCDPVYLHLGDPDAVDWRVNCGPEGVLTHMDGLLAKKAKSGEGLPQMIAGGYNFGAHKDSDDPSLNAARFGNALDRHLRVQLSERAPKLVYPTEPNLFVRARDQKKGYDLFANGLFDQGSGRVKKQGGLMGLKNAEGNALRSKLFKAEGLKTNDPKHFLHEEASITTTAPGRVLKSTTGKTPYARLFEHEQSFAKPGALFRPAPKNQKKVWDKVRGAFHEKYERHGLPEEVRHPFEALTEQDADVALQEMKDHWEALLAYERSRGEARRPWMERKLESFHGKSE